MKPVTWLLVKNKWIVELATQLSYITGYEVIPGQGVTVGTLRWRGTLNVGHQSYGCERA